MKNFLFERLKEQIKTGRIKSLDELVEVLDMFQIDFKLSALPTVKRVSSKTLESIGAVKLTSDVDSDSM